MKTRNAKKKKKQEGKKSESLHASMHVLSQANYGRNFNTISKHANLKTKPIKGIAMIIFQD